MVVLDTDHMTLLEPHDSKEGQRINARLKQLPIEEIATTIVTFEEQTRGWMAFVKKARKVVQLIEAYGRLKRQLDNYCALIVLAFDELAAVHYQRLTAPGPRRIGQLDLRIAAITLAHDAILLSRNVTDFRKVPGLRVEDWTI